MALGSIFVSNDDQAFVELIADLITDAGYGKTVWHIGEGAFHRIRDEQPRLVLVDINIGNPARGWSTLDSLRLDPKTRFIPVIICSTNMQMVNEKAEMLRKLNCQILEKPFELETLLDMVASILGPPRA